MTFFTFGDSTFVIFGDTANAGFVATALLPAMSAVRATDAELGRSLLGMRKKMSL
jgi:hypothetical protein